MAIANIVVRGYGFTPGSTKFIPTRGYLASVVAPTPTGTGRPRGFVVIRNPEPEGRREPETVYASASVALDLRILLKARPRVRIQTVAVIAARWRVTVQATGRSTVHGRSELALAAPVLLAGGVCEIAGAPAIVGVLLPRFGEAVERLAVRAGGHCVVTERAIVPILYGAADDDEELLFSTPPVAIAEAMRW